MYIPNTEDWKKEELQQTLYQRETNLTYVRIVHELHLTKIPSPIKGEKEAAKAAAATKDGEEEEEVQEDNYLDLDLSGGQIQIVEFYAPWCPHCQHFAPHYVKLANQTKHQAISQEITFNAISCTLYQEVCEYYEVEGYPTVFGWKEGTDFANMKKRGIMLNEEGEPSPMSIGEDLQFDLAQDKVVYDREESRFSNSEDQRQYLKDKIQRGINLAKEKVENFEYDFDINEIYHNAAASLCFLLKTAVFSSSRKGLTTYKKEVLHEFLELVDWATPEVWDFKRIMVRDLLQNYEKIMAGGKTSLENFVLNYQKSNFKTGKRKEELLWGHLHEKPYRKRQKELTLTFSGLGAEHGKSKELTDAVVAKEHAGWTPQCTHDEPSTNAGYTCGLWNLFHILTVGATQKENQFYGFHRGYFTSSKDVAATIRNFIAEFFRCEVCRSNFLKMYEGCGHDHCFRLDFTLPLDQEKPSKEISLWLFEVHNAVNERLLREWAQRERRVFSSRERKDSKFPTPKQCKSCWLDDANEVWDPSAIVKFLERFYWPSTSQIHLRHLELDQHEATPLSQRALGFVLLPILCIMYQFVKKYVKQVLRSPPTSKLE